MMGTEADAGYTDSGERIPWCCRCLCEHQHSSQYLSQNVYTGIDQDVQLLSRHNAQDRDVHSRTEFVRPCSRYRLRSFHLTSYNQFRFLNSSKMSNDDKARAAAAQLVIDDEPDDWYVSTAESRGRANELIRMLGTSASTVRAVRVRLVMTNPSSGFG